MKTSCVLIVIVICFQDVVTGTTPSSSTVDSNALNSATDASLPSATTRIRVIRTGPIIDFTKLTIEQFCGIFRVPKVNCTCDKVINSLTGKSFCQTKNETIAILKNNTQKQRSEFRDDNTLNNWRASLTLIATIVAIIGNSLVLLVSARNRKDIGRHKLLIAVLAGCDLVFAIVQLVFIIPMFWTSKWVYGLTACKILPAMYSLGALLAMGIIVIIAIERYIGIVHPFRSNLSQQVTIALLVVNVLVCIGAVIPQMVVREITAQESCKEIWPRAHKDSLIYSWFLLIVFFAVPCLAVIVLYILIILSLYANTRRAAGLTNTDEKMRKKRQADNKRIVLILVCILVAFIILVLPNRLVWVVFDTIGDISTLSQDAFNRWKYIGLLPYPFHVTVNPIIYSLIDPKLRRDIAKMCGCYHLHSSSSTKSDSLSPKTTRTSQASPPNIRLKSFDHKVSLPKSSSPATPVQHLDKESMPLPTTSNGSIGENHNAVESKEFELPYNQEPGNQKEHEVELVSQHRSTTDSDSLIAENESRNLNHQ